MKKFNLEKALEGAPVSLKNGTVVDKIESYEVWHEWPVTAYIGNRKIKYTVEGKLDPDTDSKEDMVMAKVIDV